MICWACGDTRNARKRWALAWWLLDLRIAGAGDVDDVAGVVRRQERDLGVHVGRADLVPDPVPVVLVDDPEGGAAAVDLVDDGLVVGVDAAAGVRGEPLEPADRRGIAVGLGHRGHHRLEVGLRGREGELALVGGPRELHHAGRQRARRDQARVVDDDAHARRDPDPVALRRAVLGRHLGERARQHRTELALALQVLERGRVLGVEDVRRASSPPSVLICAARVSSSALRVLTVIPVAFSNACTSAAVVWTCWPL